MKSLAIIITHPIQYYVPVFRILAKHCKLRVFYTWGKGGLQSKYDPGFGKTIAWDLPLLDGYEYELLENSAKVPGSHHGNGIINPHIISRIQAFAPHSILIYGYIYKSHLQVMRHFKGKIPIWFRGDSTLLDEVPVWKGLTKKIYLKWVFSHVDKAFYVGSQNKAYFQNYGLDESQLVFAPHAVDNERFAKKCASESDALRTSLGVREGDILILFAGKFESKKNPDLLLRAFLELKDERNNTSGEGKNIHLLFVGNGNLESKLKATAASHKNIHFMDFQNQTQMPVVYQACDIFCLPSQGPGETWGLAINEAMSAGKAIIASNKVGCAIDLVKQEKNGIIFQSNDISSLKLYLERFENGNYDINQFGKSSSEIISSWNIDQQADAYLRELE